MLALGPEALKFKRANLPMLTAPNSEFFFVNVLKISRSLKSVCTSHTFDEGTWLYVDKRDYY